MLKIVVNEAHNRGLPDPVRPARTMPGDFIFWQAVTAGCSTKHGNKNSSSVSAETLPMVIPARTTTGFIFVVFAICYPQNRRYGRFTECIS